MDRNYTELVLMPHDKEISQGESYYLLQFSRNRYINHSCSPNLDLVLVRRASTIPHLVFIVNRFVSVDEELNFDYGEGTQASENNEGVECQCGSAICRGKLPFSAKI